MEMGNPQLRGVRFGGQTRQKPNMSSATTLPATAGFCRWRIFNFAVRIERFSSFSNGNGRLSYQSSLPTAPAMTMCIEVRRATSKPRMTPKSASETLVLCSYSLIAVVQLGSSPELITDLSIYSSAPANARVASLVPGMDASELNRILKTPGSPLRIALASPDIPAASSITATFDLPADATPAQTAIDPCIQHAEAAAAALRDSRPVSCPARPGLVLVDGTVRNATTRKVLPVEPERDQGVGWLLPKPTKAHPIPPKLILQCDYAPPSSAPLSANTGGAVRKATESLNLPIPAAAAGDEFETWIHVTESRSESYCAKPPRADPTR